MFQKVAFIGLGLIGGSIARAIREKYPRVRLAARTASTQTLAYACDQGLIQETPGNLALLAGDADLIILATPIELIPEYLRQVYPCAGPGAVIIDTGSTKARIVEGAKKYADKFIGCHPMFGSEKSGVQNADSRLLRGARFVFTPYKNTPEPKLRAVQQFFKALGARPCRTGAREHDAAVAAISHVPYFNAAALLRLADDDARRALAATGFQSCTRVAESDPDWGLDIARTNKKEVLSGLQTLQKELRCLEKLITRAQFPALRCYLELSRQTRRKIYPQ
ncbi:MAG: prephenate dehydrogenase/arogenate dehydrogenase family protein [Candidatus Margulisbacteria bacterium]|jgi:prephenate dehydrogenase|nr:prephenate dehydrogenase/arogenate dehydrogenase family protein [Candidatus Margulisiibacteriota bacterium]